MEWPAGCPRRRRRSGYSDGDWPPGKYGPPVAKSTWVSIYKWPPEGVFLAELHQLIIGNVADAGGTVPEYCFPIPVQAGGPYGELNGLVA